FRPHTLGLHYAAHDALARQRLQAGDEVFSLPEAAVRAGGSLAHEGGEVPVGRQLLRLFQDLLVCAVGAAEGKPQSFAFLPAFSSSKMLYTASRTASAAVWGDHFPGRPGAVSARMPKARAASKSVPPGAEARSSMSASGFMPAT